MKRMLLKMLGFTALAACFAGSSFAQVELTMTGVNPQQYAVYGWEGGAFTSPYTFTVGDPSNPIATGVFLSCDDFMHNVNPGDQWFASTTSLQNDILGEAQPNTTVEFDTTNAAQQQLDYQEVAFLAATLMQVGTPTQFADQTSAELTFAIWAVFDPTDVATFLAGPLTDSGGNVLVNFAADVNADILAAHNFVTGGGTVANELVYTPVPGTSGPPQEFIQVWGSNSFAPAAEPFFVAGLAIDLMFVFGLVTVLRRRFSHGK